MYHVVSHQGDRKEYTTLTEWNGYAGQVLDVDLEKGTTQAYPLDRGLAADYVGGKGFGARILSDQLAASCSPFLRKTSWSLPQGHSRDVGAGERPFSGLHQEPCDRPLVGLELRRVLRS